MGFLTIISSFLAPYLLWIRLAVLAACMYGVHYADVKFAEANQVEKTITVVKSIPQIITQTQTITKVIHDATDSCTNAVMPFAVYNELRK